MKREAELNAESDKKAKEDAEVLNGADSVIFNIEKALKDLDDKISEEQKLEVVESLEKLKEAHKNKDIESIKTTTEEVNTKFQKITQDLYSQVSEQMEGMNFDGSDVEFEEVNNK
jgi:molecular chaperone DnaK